MRKSAHMMALALASMSTTTPSSFDQTDYKASKYISGSPMKYGSRPTKKTTARYHKRKAKYKAINKSKYSR